MIPLETIHNFYESILWKIEGCNCCKRWPYTILNFVDFSRCFHYFDKPLYFDHDPIFSVAFFIHTRKFSMYHWDFFLDIFAVPGSDKSQCIPFFSTVRKRNCSNFYCTNHILKDVEYWSKQHGRKKDIKVLQDDITQLID